MIVVVAVWWIACLLWSAGQFLPSALSSVLQATSPVFGFLIGTATGAERFTMARGIALPIGVDGVALVSRGQFDAGRLSGLGSAAVLAGGACAAVAYAIAKRRTTHLPPTVMVAAPAGRQSISCHVDSSGDHVVAVSDHVRIPAVEALRTD